MDRFRPDEDNSIEPSQLTAEQILAEFWAEQEREEAQPPQPMATETPGPETEPEEDVRVYVTPLDDRDAVEIWDVSSKKKKGGAE